MTFTEAYNSAFPFRRKGEKKFKLDEVHFDPDDSPPDEICDFIDPDEKLFSITDIGALDYEVLTPKGDIVNAL